MADEGGKKTELATERTEYAEDRTVLANERTYAGWMRTGLAAVGVGVGFNALFGRMEPEWLPKVIATLLLGIAIFIFVAAERRACAIISRLRTHEVETLRIRNLRWITAGLVLATLGLIGAFWFAKLKPGGGMMG